MCLTKTTARLCSHLFSSCTKQYSYYEFFFFKPAFVTEQNELFAECSSLQIVKLFYVAHALWEEFAHGRSTSLCCLENVFDAGYTASLLATKLTWRVMNVTYSRVTDQTWIQFAVCRASWCRQAVRDGVLASQLSTALQHNCLLVIIIIIIIIKCIFIAQNHVMQLMRW